LNPFGVFVLIIVHPQRHQQRQPWNNQGQTIAATCSKSNKHANLRSTLKRTQMGLKTETAKHGSHKARQAPG